MANLLVTGGAGFLGSHLVDTLVARGHDVTIFDRTRSKWASDRVKQVVGELGDRDALAEVVAGKDAVFHLAGFSDLNAAKTRPLDTVQANILGTVHLLEAMRQARVT